MAAVSSFERSKKVDALVSNGGINSADGSCCSFWNIACGFMPASVFISMNRNLVLIALAPVGKIALG